MNHHRENGWIRHCSLGPKSQKLLEQNDVTYKYKEKYANGERDIIYKDLYYKTIIKTREL